MLAILLFVLLCYLIYLTLLGLDLARWDVMADSFLVTYAQKKIPKALSWGFSFKSRKDEIPA
jgi:hypothetical protein